MKFFAQLYLTTRFFIALTAVAALFALSYGMEHLYPVAQTTMIVVTGALILDGFLLFGKNAIQGERHAPMQLSLGDENPIRIDLKNEGSFPLVITVIDELPYQLQKRNHRLHTTLEGEESKTLRYFIKPTKRGEYIFHDINVYAQTLIGLTERRYKIPQENKVKVYPSVIQMRKHELMVFSKTSIFQGIKKIRRLGNNNEFEQIKEYVQGDDYRAINWKATSRKNELMVNQYQDEKSQQVYSVIDKSRLMRMPFNGLTLLDYAINSSLVISNIVMRKGDKAGLTTFAEKPGHFLPAERSAGHLRKIIELLYNQKTRFQEADYQRMYNHLRNNVKGRSLLMLYTNFETLSGMKRNLPVLRRLNQQHLLVVILFENNELENMSKRQAHSLRDVYDKTIAESFILEKRLIAHELRNLGIQCIITSPEKLTVDSINKYLELKSRGLI